MVTKARQLFLGIQLLLLVGCDQLHRANAACAALNNTDLEAAIPGVPFKAGEGSFSDDIDEDYTNANCAFHSVSEQPWMTAYLEVYDGKPQPVTIDALRRLYLKDKCSRTGGTTSASTSPGFATTRRRMR